MSRVFIITALTILVLGLFFGFWSSLLYLYPDLKVALDFSSLRPLHVSSVLFWILLGATGCVYMALSDLSGGKGLSSQLILLQWILYVIGLAAIYISYFGGKFGGREYWEFPPVLALFIALAWGIFIFNFFKVALKIPRWPVYIWMWMTGAIFFAIIFAENYLWIFPFFREHLPTDMTIQWKVNGSLVGAWNQLLYGTAFYITDKISGNNNNGSSRIAFVMYFLGLFNLMFNWGHHVYTLPTQNYVKYTGYLVSMTEWVFFLKIIYTWKKSLLEYPKNHHLISYRFIIASEFWVFLNMFQALLMSIPALNIYTHGTHITVAHAMGTTIGINSMILMAAFFFFTENKTYNQHKLLNITFYTLQVSLLVFWLSLNIAGIQKGLWQLSENRSAFSTMMEQLRPYFGLASISGLVMMIAFEVLAYYLLTDYIRAIRAKGKNILSQP